MGDFIRNVNLCRSRFTKIMVTPEATICILLLVYKEVSILVCVTLVFKNLSGLKAEKSYM